MKKAKPLPFNHIYNRKEKETQRPPRSGHWRIEDYLIILMALVAIIGFHFARQVGNNQAAERIILEHCETGEIYVIGDYAIQCSPKDLILNGDFSGMILNPYFSNKHNPVQEFLENISIRMGVE